MSVLKVISVVALAGGLAIAQNAATKPTMAKPGEKLSTHASPNLPSEATVDSFQQQQLGYEKDISP